LVDVSSFDGENFRAHQHDATGSEPEGRAASPILYLIASNNVVIPAPVHRYTPKQSLMLLVPAKVDRHTSPAVWIDAVVERFLGSEFGNRHRVQGQGEIDLNSMNHTPALEHCSSVQEFEKERYAYLTAMIQVGVFRPHGAVCLSPACRYVAQKSVLWFS